MTPKKSQTKAKAASKKKATKKNYIYAVGRRRTSAARIRLFKGKKQSIVNKLPIDQYFPGAINKSLYEKPYQICDLLGKYYATIRVVGSGKRSQLDACVHGIARAIDKVDPDKYHTILKKYKLLTRDARARERRKAGQAGRARHKKQSPKR